MSLDATIWATSPAAQSIGGARALLCILANMANKEHGHACWPSDETLAEAMHCSERTIWRYIGDLKACGDIAVQSGGGRSKRNIYSFPALTDTVFPDNGGRESTPETLTTVSGNPPETLTNGALNPDNPGRETLTNGALNPDTIVSPIKQPLKATVLKTTEQQPRANNQSSSTSTPEPKTDDDDDFFALDLWLGDFSEKQYSAGEVRCAARSLGADNGLQTEWAGFEGWVERADPQKIAWLLTWLQFYGDKPLEAHENIKSLTAILRTHLKNDERAHLRPAQMAKLERYIARVNELEELPARIERELTDKRNRGPLPSVERRKWVPADPSLFPFGGH